MTDKQAARLEKLLRLHAIQLNNISAQLNGIFAATVGDDVASDPEFQRANIQRASEMKVFVIEVLSRLTADMRSENQPAAEEMREFDSLLAGKLKN